MKPKRQKKKLAIRRDGPVASFEMDLRNPNAPWLPSSSKAIDHRAFVRTPDAPTLAQVMERLRVIEHRITKLSFERAGVLPERILAAYAPPPQRWWTRLLRTLFMPWREAEQ